MELGLQGKRALVTGGSRGIGKAIARALGAEGVRICLCARGAEGLARAEAELRAEGIEAVSLPADVAAREAAEAAVGSAIALLGGLDLLINDVGGSLGAGPFDAAGPEAWERVVAVNLMSAVWCSRPAVAWMKENGGGAIVNVASIYGREYGGSAPYVAAKGGLIALT